MGPCRSIRSRQVQNYVADTPNRSVSQFRIPTKLIHISTGIRPLPTPLKVLFCCLWKLQARCPNAARLESLGRQLRKFDTKREIGVAGRFWSSSCSVDFA